MRALTISEHNGRVPRVLDTASCANVCKTLMTFLPQLRALAVERLRVPVEGLRALAALPALVHLELRSNKIGSKGVVALAEVLKVSGSLVSLILANNQIGPEGAVALLEALKVPNGSLGTLNLAGNDIGAEGAAALAEALKVVNNSLCTVNLAR